MTIITDAGDGNCPDQLTENSVNISVEQDNRVGFFQQHIIHVSWSLPNSMLTSKILCPLFSYMLFKQQQQQQQQQQ